MAKPSMVPAVAELADGERDVGVGHVAAGCGDECCSADARREVGVGVVDLAEQHAVAGLAGAQHVGQHVTHRMMRQLRAIARRGSTPQIVWEPWDRDVAWFSSMISFSVLAMRLPISSSTRKASSGR